MTNFMKDNLTPHFFRNTFALIGTIIGTIIDYIIFAPILFVLFVLQYLSLFNMENIKKER